MWFCILKSVYNIPAETDDWKACLISNPYEITHSKVISEGRSPLQAAGPCESEVHLNTSFTAAVT